MNNLNQYIQEKLKINKDSKNISTLLLHPDFSYNSLDELFKDNPQMFDNDTIPYIKEHVNKDLQFHSYNVKYDYNKASKLINEIQKRRKQLNIDNNDFASPKYLTNEHWIINIIQVDNNDSYVEMYLTSKHSGEASFFEIMIISDDKDYKNNKGTS